MTDYRKTGVDTVTAVASFRMPPKVVKNLQNRYWFANITNNATANKIKKKDKLLNLVLTSPFENPANTRTPNEKIRSNQIT